MLAMNATAPSVRVGPGRMVLTVTPLPASPYAMAKPMPPVEPVTMAVLPESSMIMCLSS